MPYISPQRRDNIDQGDPPTLPGELNYVITCLLIRYVVAFGMSYGTINDVLGALEGAKLEFYRRVAAPYENIKREQNGDVYS